jgi:hypothetical protein
MLMRKTMELVILLQIWCHPQDIGKRAISTLEEEISELDTMGFDENLLLYECVDM